MKNTVVGLWIGAAFLSGLTGAGGCASKPATPDLDLSQIAGPVDQASARPNTNPSGLGAAQPTPAPAANPVMASASPNPGGNAPGESATAAKPAPWGDATIATVNKLSPVSISAAELVQPLIEAHGLDMLLVIVQRDLAKQGAESAKPPIVVTSEDFKAERERTLALMFQDLDAKIQDEIDKAEKAKKPAEVKRWQDEREIERQQLLKQFYEQKHLTPTDFGIVIQTNTYLRKIADPSLNGKITDAMLRAEFGARFGEKVRVRHIQLSKPQDYTEVKRRLAGGEKFEDVARQVSTNAETAALGGLLPPFNREAQLPKVFKEVAFDLQPGQVSDLVNADDTFHLIKLEERIMPKAIVFEQQRDILFRDVHEQMVQSVIGELRRRIAVATRESLKITDPVMEKQLEDRIKELNATAKGKEAAELEMTKERDRLRLLAEQWKAQQAATQPATQPAATQPATPALPPVTAPAIVMPAQPPATVPTPPAIVPPVIAPATQPAAAPVVPAPASRPAAPIAPPAAPGAAPAAPTRPG